MKNLYNDEQVISALTKAEIEIEKSADSKVKCVFFRIEHIRQTPSEFMVVVCDALGLSKETVTGKDRQRDLADARKLSAYFIQQIYVGIKQEDIALAVGWNDHSSVSNGIVQLQGLLDGKDVMMTIKYNRVTTAITEWLKSI